MDKSLYPILIKRIPEFVQENYPNFVEFLTIYYKWLESKSIDSNGNIEDNFLRALLDFDHNKDIFNQNDYYINLILKSLGFYSDREIQVGKHFLIMFLKEFYLSKGSKKSFDFLFNLFFKKSVDIQYSREYLARTSNNVYTSKYYMITTSSMFDSKVYKEIVNNKNAILSTTVRGTKSNAIAIVENINEYYFNNKNYLEIQIQKPSKDFIINEPININYNNIYFVELIVPTVKINIINPGYFYSKNDIINLVQPNSILNGIYSISHVTNGKIDEVEIINGGNNYQVNDYIKTFGNQDGVGFFAKVSKVDSNGAIQEIRIINNGWRYEHVPNLIVISATGKNAILKAKSNSIGRIKSIDTIYPMITENLNDIKHDLTNQSAIFEYQLQPYFETQKKFLNEINDVLGKNIILTDSNFYQQFAYSIVSDESPESYRDLIPLVHPVGYNRFNVLSLYENDITQLMYDTTSQFKKSKHIFEKINFNAQIGNYEKFIIGKNIVLAKEKSFAYSINIIDKLKFSPNLNWKPLDFNIPVIDGINNKQFVFQTLDSEITIS